MKITQYDITTSKLKSDLCIAVVSDLHARPFQAVIKALEQINPHIILLPGDILEVAQGYMEKRNQNAIAFLKEAVKLAPVYYCYGNHELYYSHAKFGRPKATDPYNAEKYRQAVMALGVHMINDAYESVQISTTTSIKIGGLVCGRDKDPNTANTPINKAFLKTFESEQGFKILLCHYPHYYQQYLKDTCFDLVLSGHAHGGQWRFFDKGIYAPHQGLFPKYTSGLHDGKHIISCGAANNISPIPRFFNPCEVLKIHIQSQK